MRPRERVMSHLRAVGEVSDPGGLASTALAEAVDYPGSSVAFAQLLSAMERSGLIEREIRGRRTYRIVLAPAAVVRGRVPEPGAPGRPADRQAGRPVPGGGAGTPEPGPGPEPGPTAGFDYDELARRLLGEMARRLAAAPGITAPGYTVPGNGPVPDAERSLAEREPGLAPPPGHGGTGEPVRVGDLAGTVANLEQKLASVEVQQRTLRAENARLREQLAATRQSMAEQQSLTAAQEPGARLTALDTGSMQLLERLLASLRGEAGRGQGAQAG